jgi:hypothetical protein
MQDRYAGDVGDFLNFALLRLLVASSDLLLGIIWYRVPDERHNGDGRHNGYLDPDNRIGRHLRSLDPDLHHRLREVVRTGRSIESVERSGALPAGTTTFGEPVGADRADWSDRASAATEVCDVVFLDPDNGIRRSDHPSALRGTRSEKHAYLDELRPFVERGQSVIVYHHADRSAPVYEQAQRRLADVAEELDIDPLGAVRASRGSCRLFLVLPSEDHREHFTTRFERIEESPWRSELTVYRSAARPVCR